MKHRLLLVDDDQSIRFAYSRFFKGTDFEFCSVGTLAGAWSTLESRDIDVLLLDLMLPDGKSSEHISGIRGKFPDLLIIVISGHGDIPVAVESMRLGADNFLTKPVSLRELENFLRSNIEKRSARGRESARLPAPEEEGCYFGESSRIRRVMELASTAADNESAVLLTGETGSGKGVLARWIHDRSARSSGNFVAINCSSLKGEMLANELFGHARGAYTSAVKDRPGLIQHANRGTLFLDEISNMSTALQAEFLKVVEEKQYRRLGEDRLRTSDFRLICSTNRDLVEEVEEEHFRQDLFFRINVFPIEVPPLRVRSEDIPGLARCILENLGAGDRNVPENVMGMLSTYSWPGNVRELKNSLERALLLAGGDEFSVEHFPALRSDAGPGPATAGSMSLREREYDHIRKVLEKYGGDKDRAASALGISKATLNRKLKRAG